MATPEFDGVLQQLLEMRNELDEKIDDITSEMEAKLSDMMDDKITNAVDNLDLTDSINEALSNATIKIAV